MHKLVARASFVVFGNQKCTQSHTSNLLLITQRKMATSTPSKFKFAGIQLLVTDDKEKNLINAAAKIKEAAQNGAKIIALPECFNCPYSNDAFPGYSEEIPNGPTWKMLQQAAKDLNVYVIGGSIPEREVTDGRTKLYNTSLTFSPKGELLAKHRKVHLFDIDIPGKITFQESKTLSRGNNYTTFDTEFCKFGIAICYDIRFPELALAYGQQGCKMLVYPGAFNMTTGPAHWELLQRSRALDNQLFVATVSPARNPQSSYQAWGHSTVCDPWGQVIATTDHEPTIIYADIDLKKLEEVREQIPVLKQKRSDMYSLSFKLKE